MRAGTRRGGRMERERHEPTFGKQEMAELHFRARPRAYPRTRDEPRIPWVPIALGVAAAVGIAMGLIEWNARRQAAAMTAELMRPMTKSDQAAFDREMSKLDEQLERDLEAVMPRSVRLSAPAEQYAPLPLRPGERCISGHRLKRIEGGWQDVPDQPC